MLVKTSDIVHGLQACLDFENGKEIAGVLHSFYSSVDTRLFSVHRSNSADTCDEVITDLKKMRDAWINVDEQVLENAAPTPAPSAAAEAAPEALPSGESGVTLSA